MSSPQSLCIPPNAIAFPSFSRSDFSAENLSLSTRYSIAQASKVFVRFWPFMALLSGLYFRNITVIVSMFSPNLFFNFFSMLFIFYSFIFRMFSRKNQLPSTSIQMRSDSSKRSNILHALFTDNVSFNSSYSECRGGKKRISDLMSISSFTIRSGHLSFMAS